ncbi:MAG: urease accessory protein UreE [Rubrivivax sp.]|nr:urease accessory protein UreE [Rubrivivax sp.]
MLTANKVIPQARGLAPALLKRATTVALDWDLRQKSRFDATDSSGRHLGIFLPRGTVVRGGDVLVAEDGSLVRVEAAPQPVLVVRPCSEHGSPSDLLRAAYHLGNRHVAVELKPDHLKFEPDPVLGEMLQRLHLVVSEALAPFEPEGGAYAAHGGDAHAHEHGHGHGHAHGSPPAATAPRGKPLNVPIAAAPTPHVHGPDCGHGHDHGHRH